MTVILAALTGYLLGSISGARLVGRFRVPGQDLSRTRVILDGTGASVTTDGVSPSSLDARAGAKAGLASAAIDIAKALVPTLIARLVWPDGPEHVVLAAGALVGHVYPIYHRFVGGFGVSPLIGGLLVVDWQALVAAIVVFLVVGLFAGNAFLAVESWPLALIPWFVWRGDPSAFALAVVANTLYWWRTRHEAAAAFRAWRMDTRPWKDRVKDFSTYPDYEVQHE